MEKTQIEPQHLINPYKIQKAQRVLKQFQSPSIAGGAKNKFRPFVSPMLFILISSGLQGGMMGNWAICINRLADEVTWLWEQGSTQRRPQNDLKARCQREGIDRWITDLCPYICHQTFEDVPVVQHESRGGGESFKNRKPIGEIGCCESRTSEQKYTD